MKYGHLVIITAMMLNVACGSSKKMAEKSISQQMGENEIREYNYALTEATKQKLFGNFKQAAIVKRLPKTRSGKILRGIMSKIADSKEYTIPSTIDDPAILGEIEEALKRIGYAKK